MRQGRGWSAIWICSLAATLLQAIPTFAYAGAVPEPPRDPVAAHGSSVPPSPALLKALQSVTDAKVFSIAFTEPGCPGNPGWAERTIDCLSVRRIPPRPPSTWRDAMVRLLSNPNTYALQFDKLCICSPETLVRLTGEGVTIDAVICLGCDQITVRLNGSRGAFGGCDLVHAELTGLVREALVYPEDPDDKWADLRRQHPWMLGADEFPLEGDSLAYEKAPIVLIPRSGVRIVKEAEGIRPDERRIRVRFVSITGRRFFMRLPRNGEISGIAIAMLDSLNRAIVYQPASFHGGPVSSWVDLAIADSLHSEWVRHPELEYYDEPPVALTKVAPIYPDFARKAGIVGDITLHVVVGADGNVGQIRVAQGAAALNDAAIAAVRRWVFKAALRGAKPVAAATEVRVHFPPEKER